MFNIDAKIRREYGKSASRRLRAINKFPAVIYGGGIDPISIELDHNKIWNIQNKTEFHNNLITITIDGRKENVKIQAIQRHAYKPKLIHIDFIRVKLPIF